MVQAEKPARRKGGRPKGSTDTKPRKPRRDGNPPPPTGPGPGRPAGSTNALPAGAVGAIRGLRFRVPADTPKPLADVADEALEVVVQAMQGKIPANQVFARFLAAKALREEVCGKQVQKHAVEGTVYVATGVPRSPDDPPEDEAGE